MTKIMEGKYQKKIENKTVASAPPAHQREVNQETSQSTVISPNGDRPSSPSQEIAMQEANLFRKIAKRDPSQVKNPMATDPSVVHQEHNLDRKIDLPLPPSLHHNKVLEPSVPNPFEDNSWLAQEIEMLLNKKSRMTISQFRFEVNPEAASSNFEKLSRNNFDLEKLLNPAKRCATSYGSEFKEV